MIIPDGTIIPEFEKIWDKTLLKSKSNSTTKQFLKRFGKVLKKELDVVGFVFNEHDKDLFDSNFINIIDTIFIELPDIYKYEQFYIFKDYCCRRYEYYIDMISIDEKDIDQEEIKRVLSLLKS
jgi:hypothetical protein